MKRRSLILLGTVLLASVGAAIFTPAPYQPATRGAELENFHLVGATGRSYSIESFPRARCSQYFSATRHVSAPVQRRSTASPRRSTGWASSAPPSSPYLSIWIPRALRSHD